MFTFWIFFDVGTSYNKKIRGVNDLLEESFTFARALFLAVFFIAECSMVTESSLVVPDVNLAAIADVASMEFGYVDSIKKEASIYDPQ